MNEETIKDWKWKDRAYVYHATTPENAVKIIKDRKLKRGADGLLFFSLDPNPSYGGVIFYSKCEYPTKGDGIIRGGIPNIAITSDMGIESFNIKFDDNLPIEDIKMVVKAWKEYLQTQADDHKLLIFDLPKPRVELIRKKVRKFITRGPMLRAINKWRMRNPDAVFIQARSCDNNNIQIKYQFKPVIRIDRGGLTCDDRQISGRKKNALLS